MIRSSNNPGRDWKDYRPSKIVWFWSSISVVILTMIVGFGWSGWVTAGTAQAMAEEAADRARARLVANVCVQRYISADRFASRFIELKNAVTFKREDLIQDGGWTTLPGVDEPVPGAARLCANELARMNVPNIPVAEPSNGSRDITG